MVGADRRDPSSDVSIDSVPRHAVLLASTPKRLPPEPYHAESKRLELCAVAGHPVVSEVSVDDATQVGALLWDGVVQAKPQLGCNLTQFRLPAFPLSLPQQEVPASSTCPTDMGE